MATTRGQGRGRSGRGSASSRPAPKRSGSASRRPAASRREDANPAQPGVRRLPSWIQPRARRSQRLAAFLGVLVVLAVLLVPTLTAWYHQRQQISALHEQVATQERQVADLERESARWNDEAYVISQARQRLKFVKVGETAYTVIDGDPAEKTDPSLASAPAAGEHPWYGRLWGSIQVADAPAAQK